MSHHNHTSNEGHEHNHVHACPLWILGAVFAVLLVLTVLTVLTALYVDLGAFNFPLAMLIALFKGALVALFFMHLWWDSKFNSIALVAGLAFLALFITFSIVDTHAYQNTVDPQDSVLNPTKLEFHAHEDPAHDKPADAAH